MTTRTKSAYVCVLEDETYKDFVKILLTVHKRVYDMKHKMDIWFFQEEKNMKNISAKNTKVSA